ncbi:ABC transporter permease [Protaetiibacter larvae]|uniref:Transport permease protein n=2 Tax=Protaetiibacter larvae TaxID=2592654 RepID=A0A5C1YD36_9MICO|nr:ABC transporter permease [Protaetiibacter larvae]
MAYRALIRLRRTPEQWADVLLVPFIFTFMFAFLFGGAIAGGVTAYLPMLIPAIVVQGVVQASVVTGTQLREDMDTGVFDRFRSLPMARIAPLAGALLTDTIRYAVITGLTMFVGFLIGWRPGGGWGLLVAAVLVIVTAWAVSWIWALLGVKARTAGTVQGIAMLIMMPLTFFSNAFVPTSTLPDWLRPVAEMNPVSHLITAFRGLANDGTWTVDVWWTLLGAAVIVAVFAPLAVRAYMRKA